MKWEKTNFGKTYAWECWLIWKQGSNWHIEDNWGMIDITVATLKEAKEVAEFVNERMV